jgi:hypothetical protein
MVSCPMAVMQAGDPSWCCGRTACGPPAGWRICLAAGLFLALLLVPVSPMHPLLLLATHPGGSAGLAAGLLAVTGVAFVGVIAFLASRLP